MSQPDRLTRLYYQDGLEATTIGYFNNGTCERAARGVYEALGKVVHEAVTYLRNPVRETVDPGDADRIEYTLCRSDGSLGTIGANVDAWCSYGAESVEVRRYEVNGFRTPNGTGGATSRPLVLYILRIRAHKE